MSRSRRLREQPAAYGAVVVDASIAVQWFARERGSEAAIVLLGGGHDLLAPDIMPVEAANAWWTKWRRGDLADADVEESVTSLLALGIPLFPTAPLLPAAARLAVDLGHPVYDCVYLALAQERHAALATDDARLRRAARSRSIGLWRR